MKVLQSFKDLIALLTDGSLRAVATRRAFVHIAIFASFSGSAVNAAVIGKFDLSARYISNVISESFTYWVSESSGTAWLTSDGRLTMDWSVQWAGLNHPLGGPIAGELEMDTGGEYTFQGTLLNGSYLDVEPGVVSNTTCALSVGTGYFEDYGQYCFDHPSPPNRAHLLQDPRVADDIRLEPGQTSIFYIVSLPENWEHVPFEHAYTEWTLTAREVPLPGGLVLLLSGLLSLTGWRWTRDALNH